MLTQLWRLVLGRPLPNSHAPHTRLPKRLALAVFSSDALSSTAYASEEILRVLMIVGSAGVPAVALGWPIALGIGSLLLLVALSYRQTIFAYPEGASAYLVTKDNLGSRASLVAAAALLIDYVLTVAVSVAAGIAALTSAFPLLEGYRVALSLLCIALIALANLRGVRDSGAGRFFAIPTYSYIGSMVLLLGIGLLRLRLQGVPPPPDNSVGLVEAARDLMDHAHPPHPELLALTPFVILRAFASGCTALTGIEAISDGIPAFRKPEARNAAATLIMMVTILLGMFLGVSYLAHAFQLPALREHAPGYETLISQLGRRIFVGPAFPLYYVLMLASLAILVVAANTSYQDFPRLASLLARDRYLPRQLADQGDRLVFQNGIVVLTTASAGLTALFRAEVSALLPLYAVGVFTSFTLSQASMVRHWRTQGGPGWQSKLALNLLGAMATGAVLVVIAVTKFNPTDGRPTGLHIGAFMLHYGSWLVVLLIPLLVQFFRKINAHYRTIQSLLQTAAFPPLAVEPRLHHTALVLVPGLHRGVFPALDYARSLSPDARAVYVELNPENTPTLKEEWERHIEGVPLVILEAPYRNLREPLVEYVQEVLRGREGDSLTIIIPEIDTSRSQKWWHRLLHNTSAAAIRRALSEQPGVVITSFRYFPEAQGETT